ncbi:hypothetical protein G6F46_011336 [Rhizopus delemar]|nr:hypothetical protein G6F46_011336 [Rhizopus delemar]
MPYSGNNLKSSSDVSLGSSGTKDDGSLEKTVTADTERDQTSLEEECDGGYGWWVVLGSFLVQITSFGIVSSWCDAGLLPSTLF